MPSSRPNQNSVETRSDVQLKQNAQKIGAVGAFLGTRENAVLYITSFIIILVLALLGTLMFIDEVLRPEILKIFGAMGLAAIGFIGGLLSN